VCGGARMAFRWKGRWGGPRGVGMALAIVRATLAAVVKSSRLVIPLFLFLAACIALGGQVRAADATGTGDSDDISFSFSDDLVFTAGQRLVLSPPCVSTRALPLPIQTGLGRTVIADLFRPPIAS
jgi:hypothetical protein